MAARVAASRSSSGLGGALRCSNGMVDSAVNKAICNACSRASRSGLFGPPLGGEAFRVGGDDVGVDEVEVVD